jgi:hypothetical protein
MPTATFFVLIPSWGEKKRESFCSRQNPIAVNLLWYFFLARPKTLKNDGGKLIYVEESVAEHRAFP